MKHVYIGGEAFGTLELPVESQIHPTFHISLLKKFTGIPMLDKPTSLLISVDNQPITYPLAILDTHAILQGGRREDQILIHWGGSLPEDST